MSYTAMGLLGLICLLVLIFVKMPIAYALGITGFVGCATILGSATASSIIAKEAFYTAASYSMTVVPLFILMGNFVAITGMGDDAYEIADKWAGRVYGNTAISTMLGCAMFAAVSGSSLATAATFAPVTLPKMKEQRYPDGFATGALAAGSTIGIMIPPSVILVYYGVMAEVSVGKLFLAGILPGILLTAMFSVYCYLYSRKRRDLILRTEEKVPLLEKILSLRKAWAIIVLFTIVMGGILTGIFTPNEAAGIGCGISLFYAAIKGKISKKTLLTALVEAVKTTTMLIIIMVGAKMFNYFLVLTGLPNAVAGFILSLPIGKYGVLSLILLIYLILGCFLDSYTMITITLPFFLPATIAMGYDPIWFGILMVIISAMGLITPPLGLNVYVIAGLCDIDIYTIFKGMVPFLLVIILFAFILAIFPQIVMVLPNMM